MSTKKRKRHSTNPEQIASLPLTSESHVEATTNSASSTATNVPLSFNLDSKQASGWCAIDAEVSRCYPGANAVHFPARTPFALGGSDPLNAVSAYSVSPASSSQNSSTTNSTTQSSGTLHKNAHIGSPNQHWHFVTYGFSELFNKSDTNDAKVSGYGFELTFRLAKNEEQNKSSKKKSKTSQDLELVGSATPAIDDCPVWVIEFLQSLARYVFSTGTKFDVGHHMCLNGFLGAPPAPSSPDAINGEQSANTMQIDAKPGDDDYNISAILFVEDPLLNPIDTPNGSVKFLQVVGITQDEYELMWQTNAAYVTSLIAQRNGPLLLTRLARSSILSDGPTLQQANLYASTKGSSHSSLYNRQISWAITTPPEVEKSNSSESASSSPYHDILYIRLGANIVNQFVSLLNARLPFQRDLVCVGTSPTSSCAIIFQPSSETAPEAPPKPKRLKSSLPKQTQQTPLDNSSTIPWSRSEEETSQVLHLKLTDAQVKQIHDNLKPTQGEYRLSERITFVVEPTLIKDAQTAAPVRVIGQ